MNIGAFEQAGTHGARMDLVAKDIDEFFKIRGEIESDHPQTEVLRCRYLLRPFDDDRQKGKYILPDDVEPKDFSCCVSYHDDGSVAVSEVNGLSVSDLRERRNDYSGIQPAIVQYSHIAAGFRRSFAVRE